MQVIIHGPKRAGALSCVLLLLAGCGDDDADTTPTDAAADTADSVDATVVQCTPPEPVMPTGCETNEESESQLYLLHGLDIARREPDTDIMPGFNVDGCVTEADGPTGCGQMDWRYDVNRDGTLEEGIDNQLSTIAATLDPFIDLQEAVDEGHTLLLIQLSGLDDLENDPCVDVTMVTGSLPPDAELAHEGDRLAPDQAFVLDTATPIVSTQGVLTEGRLLLGPTDLTLDLNVAGESLAFPIDPAWMTFSVSETSLEWGILGGGTNLDDLIAAVVAILPDDVDPEVAREFLEPLTDLRPDENNENCSAISLAMVFEAVTARQAE